MLAVDCLGDLCRLFEALLALEKLEGVVHDGPVLLPPLIFPLLGLDEEGVLLAALGDEPGDQQGRNTVPDGGLRMAELQLLDGGGDVPLLRDAKLVPPPLLLDRDGVRLLHYL